MKHFLIYTNKNKDKNLVNTSRIKSYLECMGQRVTLKIKEKSWTEDNSEDSEEAKDIPTDVDYMIVLGGDGTQVCGHQQGSRQHRPQGHLGSGLLEAEAKVPDEQLGAGEERSALPSTGRWAWGPTLNL